jgi:Ca2+-binding RTX toxin-like protein/uncharacterized protein (DUF2141 family)
MPLAGFAASVTFGESTVNASPQLLDPDVAFSSASLAGGRLILSGLLAEDRISVLNEGNGAGQIGVSGATVTFGGVAIGTAAGGIGSDFTVTFGSMVTVAAVEALIERLAYANGSDTPVETRVLTVNVQDGTGLGLGGIGTLAELTGPANPLNGIDVGSVSAPTFLDLDGDGDLDLVAGASDGTLLAWRNTGTAAAPVFAALTGNANPFNGLDVGTRSAPAFLDLDGDGDLDLVAGASDGALRAWRNTGTPAAPVFTALIGSANPFNGLDVGEFSRPAFLDLDGDGDLDLVAGERSGTLLAWRNTGSAAAPGFTALTGSANPFNGLDVGDRSAPAFLDLEGDGDLDLVSGEVGGTLLAWRNTGTAAAPVFTALTGTGNPFNGIDVGTESAPAFVDLDGDGDRELVSGANNGTLRAWRNTAPLPTITVTVTAENDTPVITSAATARIAENSLGFAYQAAAMDPDGSPPLTWSLLGTDAALFSIDATGAVRFRAAPDFETPRDARGDNVHDIVIVASDGVAIGSQPVTITVTDQRERPTLTGFEPTVTFAENDVNAAPRLIDPDVVFTGVGLAGGRLLVTGLLAEDRVSILDEGKGAGQIGFDGSSVTFGGLAFGTASDALRGVFAVTFNASATGAAVDALIERLTYANTSDAPTATRSLTLIVEEGTGLGLGGIGGLEALTGNANPFGGIHVGQRSMPAFFDLDGDGDLDLVAGERYGTLLAWRNTGTAAAPVFTALTGSANPFNGIDAGFYTTPAFVDLDGDGDLDLVSGERYGTLLAWRNTGTAVAPVFTALTGTANPFNGFDVGARSAPAFVDLDGDGDLDLVSGESDNGALVVWRNTGTAAAPAFTPLTGSANPFNGLSVGGVSTPAFVDLDGDGDLDLVTGEFFGTVRAWQNVGTATAPVFSALTGSANPFNGIDIGSFSTPAFVDVDGDSDLDFVLGTATGTLLTWRNTEPPTVITVTAQNDAPVITSAASAVSTENRPTTAIVYQAATSDPDGSPASFKWSLFGADAALFRVDTTGAVRFLATPDFDAPADAGGNNVYDVVISASDDLANGTKAVAITVIDLLERATLTGFGPAVTFGEDAVNAAPRLLDADVTFRAGDSLAGGRLVVAGLLAEDRVTILAQGSGAGQIGFDGTSVTFGGVAIGTASGGAGGAFTVTFGRAVTGAAVEALIERLVYANGSDAPTATRTLTVNVLDGAGAGLGGIGSLAALTGSANPFNGIDVGLLIAPAFVDLDGDGDLDLVAGEREGALLAWRNTGSAAAPIFTALTGSNNPFNGIDVGLFSTPAFVDLDGDGDLDLVTGEQEGALLAWRNTGSAAAPIFTALTGSTNPFNGIDAGSHSTPAFVDLDGDGDFDLVSGEYRGTLLAWRNTGSVTAPVFTALTGSANPFDGIDVRFLSVPGFVDLDGDGDLDLVSGTTDGLLLAWGNTGTAAAPVFTALTGTANPLGSIGLGYNSTPAFLDLDGDGDLDLVSGEFTGTLLAWRNTAPLPAITVTVTTQNDLPTGSVTLAADSAGRLIASASLADADGLGPITLHWQALRGGIWTDIAGATGPSFTPGPAEARQVLRAEARYTDGTGAAEAVTSTTLAQIGSGAANILSANDSGVAILFGLDGDDWLSAEESAAPATLLGGTGNDRLVGGDGNDALIGGAGNDSLDGGPGADRLEGGDGDDTYQVGNGGDVLVELPGAGIDRVIAAISWTLGANLERLSLSGTANLNGTGNGLSNRLDGNAGGNVLDGGEGNDSLYGQGGRDILLGGLSADYLDGGLGADSMEGGAGDDTYVVDDAGDVMLELAGGGYDRVVSALSWTLGAEFERLSLSGTADLNGTGNGLANRLDGNAGANTLDGGEGHDGLFGYAGNDTLIGGGGNDRLDGGLGADSMEGGAGDDTYVVDDAGDVMLELAGGGYDRVVSALSWTLGAEFERLSLSGTADLNGTGNGLANRLDGNAGANTLDGGEGHDGLFGYAGNDTLIGGGGNDRLDGGLGADSMEGGAGSDIFLFTSAGEANGDVIADFTIAQGDRIDLRPMDANSGSPDNQVFSWVGSAGFGSVAGQLRFAGGLLEGDVDGDGMADFQIAFNGVTSLTAANIWL